MTLTDALEQRLRGMSGQLILVAVCQKRPEAGERGCFGWVKQPLPGLAQLAIGILESERFIMDTSMNRHPWFSFILDDEEDIVYLPTARHILFSTLFHGWRNKNDIRNHSLTLERLNKPFQIGMIPISSRSVAGADVPRNRLYSGTFLTMVINTKLVNQFVKEKSCHGYEWKRVLDELGLPEYFSAPGLDI